MAYENDDKPRGPNKVKLTQDAFDALANDRFNADEIRMIYEDMGQPGPEHLRKFLYVCTQKGLNPLLNEAHAEFRWNKSAQDFKMVIITHIDAYRKIADQTGQYDGQSTEWIENGTLLGAKSIIYRRDCTHPFEAECYLAEYSPGYGNWKSMPRVMISKVAEAACFRKAFPAALSGLYISEEMQKSAKDDTGESEPQKSAIDVAREKVQSLGGDPSVVQPPAPKSKRGKSKLDADPQKLDAEHLRMVQNFQAMKLALRQAGDGMDVAYYGILEENNIKHCNEIADMDLGRAIYKQMNKALVSLKESVAARGEIAEIRAKIGADEFWACVAPVVQDDDTLDAMPKDGLYRALELLRAYPVKASGISDDDLPSNLHGKPEPEYRKRLRDIQALMISSCRAGGKFIDLLGLEGCTKLEEVPDAATAGRIIQACEDHIQDKQKMPGFSGYREA